MSRFDLADDLIVGKEKFNLYWKNLVNSINPHRTLLTTEEQSVGSPQFILDRPAILISSTSWTKDEDFSILLDALVLYDQRSQNRTDLPFLIAIITGKGPLKSFYEEQIAALSLRKVRICTKWLESADYPLLLGNKKRGRK